MLSLSASDTMQGRRLRARNRWPLTTIRRIRTMDTRRDITAEYARQILNYEPADGILTWKVRTPDMFAATDDRSPEWLCRKWNSTWAGKSAGGLRNGYLRVRIGGKKYTASNVIWLMAHCRWPSHQIDHSDGARSRDKFDNLREATNAENCQNRKKRITNTSGYTGVSWDKKSLKWRVELAVKGRRMHLGFFEDKEKARKTYLAAKNLHHSFQPTPRNES